MQKLCGNTRAIEEFLLAERLTSDLVHTKLLHSKAIHFYPPGRLPIRVSSRVHADYRHGRPVAAGFHTCAFPEASLLLMLAAKLMSTRGGTANPNDFATFLRSSLWTS